MGSRMLIKDLIMKHDWENIESTYAKLFPDFIMVNEGNKFSTLYNTLKSMNIAEIPFKTYVELIGVSEFVTDNSMSREVVFDLDGMPKYACIGYINNNDKKEESAIMFLNHDEFIGLEISMDTLYKYSETEILATCIDCMTYFGFENGDAEIALNEATKDFNYKAIDEIYMNEN